MDKKKKDLSTSNCMTEHKVIICKTIICINWTYNLVLKGKWKGSVFYFTKRVSFSFINWGHSTSKNGPTVLGISTKCSISWHFTRPVGLFLKALWCGSWWRKVHIWWNKKTVTLFNCILGLHQNVSFTCTACFTLKCSCKQLVSVDQRGKAVQFSA